MTLNVNTEIFAPGLQGLRPDLCNESGGALFLCFELDAFCGKIVYSLKNIAYYIVSEVSPKERFLFYKKIDDNAV